MVKISWDINTTLPNLAQNNNSPACSTLVVLHHAKATKYIWPVCCYPRPRRLNQNVFYTSPTYVDSYQTKFNLKYLTENTDGNAKLRQGRGAGREGVSERSDGFVHPFTACKQMLKVTDGWRERQRGKGAEIWNASDMPAGSLNSETLCAVLQI